MKFASYPGRLICLVFAWAELNHLTFGLALLGLPLCLFSVLLQKQGLGVRLWEHTGLMAGWQSDFIMCVLNSRDSTMWNTETPHPCTKPGWIILLKRQLITLRLCNKRSVSYSAVGFSPWPVTVQQVISRVAVKVCPHTVGESCLLSAHTTGSELLHSHG